MNQNIIEIQGVSKVYGDNTVLDNLSLNIRKNEFLTLLGPSGCGKTTTLKIIAGFETADSGKVIFNGSDISNIPPYKRQLNTVPYTHESILKAVLSMSPVQVEIVQNTSNSSKLVNFNADTRTIEVSQNAEVKETIQGLIREVASIHLLSFADTELNNFKNESVAYMISKRYGMPTNNFNFDKIPQELKEMTAQEVKAELAKGAECLQILTEGMDKEIGMNSKTKTNREYER